MKRTAADELIANANSNAAWAAAWAFVITKHSSNKKVKPRNIGVITTYMNSIVEDLIAAIKCSI